MKSSIPLKALLIVSGLIGIAIGSSLLFTPVSFEASAGITLGTDINLLSEIRAPSGVLLIGGIVILLGAFVSKLTDIAIILSGLIYTTYGLSRLVGIFFDGLPNEPLLMAMIVEFVIGSISLTVLVFRLRNKKGVWLH